MKIGDYIKQYRTEHDLSGRAFAKLANLSVQHEANLENGTNSDGTPLKLSMPMVKKVAAATGIGQVELLLMLDEEVTVNPEYKQILEILPYLSQEDMKQMEGFAQNLKDHRKSQDSQ